MPGQIEGSHTSGKWPSGWSHNRNREGNHGNLRSERISGYFHTCYPKFEVPSCIQWWEFALTARKIQAQLQLVASLAKDVIRASIRFVKWWSITGIENIFYRHLWHPSFLLCVGMVYGKMYRDDDGRWWIQDDISLKHGSTVLWCCILSLSCWGCHVTRSGRWIASWRWAQLLWDHQTYKTIKNQQPTDAVGKSTKILGPPGRVHILCLPQWCCWSSIVTCLHCCRVRGHSRVISCNVEAFHHPRQLLRSSHVFMGRSAPTLPGGKPHGVDHGAWWGQRPPADPVTYSSIYSDSMNGNCILNVPAILASDLRIIKFLSFQWQSAEPCWMSKRNIFFYICMQCPFG